MNEEVISHKVEKRVSINGELSKVVTPLLYTHHTWSQTRGGHH